MSAIRPKPAATAPCGIHIGTRAMSLTRPMHEHLLGIIGRIPQHEGSENDDHREFGHSHQPTQRHRQRVHNHVHAQVVIAPGDNGGAEKGHEHHDVDLQFVGAQDAAAKSVASDDIDEVEGDRGDEGISEHAFDPPHQTIENARNHSRIAPARQPLLVAAPAVYNANLRRLHLTHIKRQSRPSAPRRCRHTRCRMRPASQTI